MHVLVQSNILVNPYVEHLS